MNTNRPNIIDEVMPHWNGRESIVGYAIRMRNERKAREAARRRLNRRLAYLVGLPLALLVGINIGATIAIHFIP